MFYSLPHSPACYAELVGMLSSSAGGQHQGQGLVTALYTQYDAIKLAAVVGSTRSRAMLKGRTTKHLFC